MSIGPAHIGRRLLLRQAESGRSEHCIRPREWLSASTNGLQHLTLRQPLATTQILQEQVQISVPAIDLASGNKREDRCRAIRALVQLELLARNSNSGNRAAGGRDRARTAKRGQPDHDLILGGAGSRCAREDVVGNVGDNVGAGVAPGPDGGEGGDG